VDYLPHLFANVVGFGVVRLPFPPPLNHLRVPKLQPRQRKFERVEKRQIYVSGFSTDVSDQMVLESFSMFGQVQSVYLARSAQGLIKGFGFVLFRSPDSAIKALQHCELSGMVMYDNFGRLLKLHVRPSRCDTNKDDNYAGTQG
jgi:hypothetical protein